MATALSAGLLKRLRAFPTVLPDSLNFAALLNSAVALNVFNYANMRPTGLLMRLRDLQYKAPGAANLSYVLTADGYQTPSIDALAAAGFDPRIDAYGDLWNAAATNTLQLQAVNQTGATINNQWQNWTVQVDHPSIAQKLQFAQQFGPLTQQEQALAEQLGLLPPKPRGVLPRPLKWIIDNEYRNQIVDAVPFSKTLAVAGGLGTQSLFIANRQPNTALVLTDFSCSAGTGTDGLQYVFGIDQESDFLTLDAYGAGSGKPMRLFMQAEQQIQLFAQSTSDTTASVAGVIWFVRLTDEIRVRLNLGVQHELGVSPVQDKIVAGVL